jgi:DNA-binding FadR family transcriptional regulator
VNALDTDLGASRVSRAEALARRMESEITSQAIPPGMRLGTKAELRQRFGVAVATMNEAVRLMESRGLVAARPGPGGGVFVANVEDRVRLNHIILGLEFGQATFGDCAEVRGALEPLVCRQAARHSTKRDIAALEACVDRMEASLGDARDYLTANWAFHRQCAAVGANASLKSVYLTMLDVLEAGLQDFDFDGHDRHAVEIHRELAAAIAQGEGPRLEAAIRRHAERSPLPG